MGYGNSIIQGGTTGASIGGTVGGPWGAAIGGTIGAVTGFFGHRSQRKKDKKNSSPKRIGTLSGTAKKEYKAYKNGLRGKGPYSHLFNYDYEGANNNFDQMVARPAYRQFNENVIPSITGQFRGNNLQNSSYLGESLSKAGRDVQENLDAQRSNMIFQGTEAANERKNQGIKDIINTQTYAHQAPTQEKSGINQILDSLGPVAAKLFADYLTKKPDAATPEVSV